jgi:hypothetical protein
MARTNRITYGQCLVLGSPRPANQSNENNLTGLKRVQSASVDFSFNRQRFKQIGSPNYIGDVNITNPNVTLGVDYLYSNGTNEVVLGLNVNGASSAVLSGLRKPLQDNNYYIMFGSGIKDEVLLTSADGDFQNNFNIMALGNCFLNSYSIQAALGQFVSVSAGIQADNAELTPYTTGYSVPAISPSTKAPDSVYAYKVKKQFFKNTTNQDGLVESALAPSGIKLTLPDNVNVPGLEFTGDGNGNSAFINSFGLEFSIDRTALYGFGTIYPYGRRAVLPVLGSLSLSATASEFQSGTLYDLVKLHDNADRGYGFTVDFIGQSGSTGLQIEVEGAKMDGQGLSESVGDNAGIDASFSFSMSDTSGLKFSTPPLVLNQPTDSSSSLGVVATGKHDLTYQWYNTTGVIGGATAATFTPSFRGEDYYCVINNDLGSADSNWATFEAL